MGKINGCIKCLFIFFNVLFAIIGCGLIYGAVKTTAYSSQFSAVGGPNLAWSWVFAIGVLGISSLGIYAGCSENYLALKIFAGFMAVGMIIMLIFGIVVVVMRNKMKDAFHSTSSEAVQPYMADNELREMLDEIQQSIHCCGLVSAQDWGSTIPQSCECQSSGGNQTHGGSVVTGCKSRPQGTTGPSQIYKQTCSDFIFVWFNIIYQLFMGFCFTFAVTALLGLLISILMIHQVKRYDRAGRPTIAMKGY
ncbi:CD63 antigen-like [Micropterus salmoides]|uniref:CD63 antigen-like n=1 Tax=Micropterus salmoides TaxID=27706 RepID=UPI0018EB0D71|nr:CD63 antigen-like [Micropterus salmoides]